MNERRTGGSPSLALLLADEDPGARRVSLLAAILLHLLLISITLPALGRRAPAPPPRRPPPIRVIPLAPPDLPIAQPVRPVPQDAVATRHIPIPDPDPESPEPVREAAAPPRPDLSLVGPVEAILPALPEPPPAAGPRTPGLDEGVTFPALIRETKTMPRYPSAARAARLEGQVTLRAVVKSDGTVGPIEVLRVTAAGVGFEQEAIDAVRRWRYRPGRQHGRPVDVYFTIIVEFVLE